MTEADKLLADAAHARQRGSASEELRLLERALQLAPDDPRVLNARGMRALKDRDFHEADKLFSAAAAADPTEPALWLNVATARRSVGNDDGEEAALERALSIDRRNFIALLRMTELHQRKGRASQAAQGWANVVQLASSIPDRHPIVADALQRGQAFLTKQGEAIASLVEQHFGELLRAPGMPSRRLNACMDHMLGRRAIYQNECAGLHYPFLPADEFFDRERFPWFSELEARTEVIRREAQALIAAGTEAIRPYVRQERGTPQNKWSPLDHSLDWSACFLWEYGERNDLVCSLCPETAAALERLPQSRIPGKAPSAFFSILKPGAHIPPHTGVTNTRAIVHLPLVVPPGCAFRVGGETREWREGEAFAFDDTIEHEAWNNSDQARIVLILDVWNPHLTQEEQDFLASFMDVVNRTGS